jgi:hypothetical protein
VEGTSGVVTAGIHAAGTPLTTLPHASPFACQQERAGASIGRSYPCNSGAPAVIARTRGALLLSCTQASVAELRRQTLAPDDEHPRGQASAGLALA